MKQLEPSFIVDAKANGKDILERHKTFVYIKAYRSILILVSFESARNWKQLKCPAVREWINKPLYNHTIEYHIAIKRNKLTHHNLDEFQMHYAK